MKNKKLKFNLKKEYNESWKYLLESEKFIFSIVGLFFFFAIVGFVVPAPDALSEQILTFIENLLEETGGMSQSELINFIFLNNLQSSFLGLIFGVFFGLFPIIVAIMNGYLLGFVAVKVVSVEGVLSLWRILPHGIFELPAIFISLGLGIKFGTFVLQDKVWDSFNKFFWSSLKVFLLIVVPLLVIAAIIEGSLIFFSG